jgi:hypothetical protein
MPSSAETYLERIWKALTNPAALPAGVNTIGNVGITSNPKMCYKVEVEVSGVHTPTTAYTAGMVLGFAGPSVIFELPNVVPANGGGGWIAGFKITTNKKSVAPIIRVHLFNANNPTIAADRALWEDLYADSAKRVTYYDMPVMSSAGNASTDMSRSVSHVDQAFRPIEFVCAVTSRSLWAAFEIGTTGFTPDADEKYKLTLWTVADV